MKYNSALITEGRNKLGDSVFARNPSGNYIRARVQPTNPQTPAQTARRNTFATYTKSWRTLTASQIAGWNSLAAATLDHDKLGQVIRPSGLQLFMRCNLNLAMLSIAPLTDPPANPSTPSPGTITWASMNVIPDVAWIAGVTVSGLTDETIPQPVFYYTKSFSQGISFVPPFMFVVAPHWGFGEAGGGNWAVYSDEPATYYPTVGEKMAIGVRAIDPTTGFGSKMTYATGTVTEEGSFGKVHRPHQLRRTR